MKLFVVLQQDKSIICSQTENKLKITFASISFWFPHLSVPSISTVALDFIVIAPLHALMDYFKASLWCTACIASKRHFYCREIFTAFADAEMKFFSALCSNYLGMQLSKKDFCLLLRMRLRFEVTFHRSEKKLFLPPHSALLCGAAGNNWWMILKWAFVVGSSSALKNISRRWNISE